MKEVTASFTSGYDAGELNELHARLIALSVDWYIFKPTRAWTKQNKIWNPLLQSSLYSCKTEKKDGEAKLKKKKIRYWDL